MKRKFGLIKALMSWGLMVAFLVVGVIATQNSNLNFGGNFMFDATDVKADIVVKQALVKYQSNHNNIPFENVGNTIKIDENNQNAGNVILGNDGMIEFSSKTNAYYLKIEIKNTFKVGGRNILVEANCFEDLTIKGFESGILDISFIGGGAVENFNDDYNIFVLPPEKTLVILIEFMLDTDVADGFDTSTQDAPIELAWVSLKRN